VVRVGASGNGITMSEKTYHAINIERTVNRMLAKQPVVRETTNYTEHEMKGQLKKKVIK